jgi:hypothetical protein
LCQLPILAGLIQGRHCSLDWWCLPSTSSTFILFQFTKIAILGSCSWLVVIRFGIAWFTNFVVETNLPRQRVSFHFGNDWRVSVIVIMINKYYHS